MEKETGAAPSLTDKEALKNFYRNELLAIIKQVFLSPVTGVYGLFTGRTEKTYFHSLLLIGSSAVITMLLIYFMIPSDARGYIPIGSIVMRAGLACIIFLFLLSLSTFGIKLLSGKPVFKNELLTGALCAIPFTLMVILLWLGVTVFMGKSDIFMLVGGDITALLQKASLMFILMIYVFLMCENIVKQSLRAGAVNETLSWYLSPLAVLLSAYFTVRLIPGLEY